MKASEVIAKLTELTEKHGDLPCRWFDPDYSSYEDVEISRILPNEYYTSVEIFSLNEAHDVVAEEEKKFKALEERGDH